IRKAATVPGYTEQIRKAAAITGMSGALRRASASSQVTDMLAKINGAPFTQVSGYKAAVDALFTSLGVEGVSNLVDLPIRPTSDDTALRLITEVSPEIGDAIEAAAENARNPLIPKTVIANTLGALLVTVVTALCISGVVLPPPWGNVISAAIGFPGVAAAAYQLPRKFLSDPPE
ncbi:MAG: hypothetical protein L0H59_05265, partial [Tomitella sp.]|nr:hypothetical protein [Tomitella sp.]